MDQSRTETALEALVKEIHEAGDSWVKAKLKADQLEETKSAFLASLQNDLESGFNRSNIKTSEAKLDRLAKGSDEYREFIVGMVTARADALRKRNRLDALKSFFEVKRSQYVTQRDANRMQSAL